MLRVRIKTKSKESIQNCSRLSHFFERYFNNLYTELNNILSDYRSVQEHTCRSKIIEFSRQKVKDLDLLQVFVKGAFKLCYLRLYEYKKDDLVEAGNRIVEMADFLYGVFEQMKTGFVPKPNFTLALQTVLDPGKLLPIGEPVGDFVGRTVEEQPISPEDFERIHRMMKVYLIQEELPSHEIKNGILTLKSQYFRFELALCGDFENPQWNLFRVHSYNNSRMVEEQLQIRLPTISSITKFLQFFESRKNALKVFESLEKRTGFYQNFTGTLKTLELQGWFDDYQFKCKVLTRHTSSTFTNPTVDKLLKHITSTLKSMETTVSSTVEFRPDLFGPNCTYSRFDMFFALSKETSVCFFGKIMPVAGVEYQKMNVYSNGSELMGIVSGTRDEQEVCNVLDVPVTDALLFEKFIDDNLKYIRVIHTLRDLGLSCIINRGIRSRHFHCSADGLTVIHGQKSITVPAKLLASQIRLAEIQLSDLGRFEVSENVIGSHIQLLIDGIELNISETCKVSHRLLNEEIQIFNITETFNYVKDFGIFYSYGILPTLISRDRIALLFKHFCEEQVEICVSHGQYTITGHKTLQLAKIAKHFTKKNTKVFVILHKVFIADRFMNLKKVLELQDKSQESDLIDLGSKGRIYLRQDGIKFEGGDRNEEKEITNALNNELSYLNYFT